MSTWLTTQQSLPGSQPSGSACRAAAKSSASKRSARRLGQLGEEALQHRTDPEQLAAMHRGELGEHGAAARREAQLDLAPVAARGRALNQLLLREAVDQANRAVVLDEELLREHVDRHAAVVGTGTQDQH